MNLDQGQIQLSPQKLDEFLQYGWYRIGVRLFTLDYTWSNNELVRVFWIRYCLKNYLMGRKQKEILNKNKGFSWRVKPLDLKPRHELLFRRYRQNIDFDGPESASSFLFNAELKNAEGKTIFPSWMIEVKDNDKLIAIGVLDKGKNSIAGILNFYDPEYARFSLGKFLMLKKMELAQTWGMKYYYPGYVGINFPKLEYKYWLGENCIEFFDPLLQEWEPGSRKIISQRAEMQIQNFTTLYKRSAEINLLTRKRYY
jgi:arginine-tRNA-protein transferase